MARYEVEDQTEPLLLPLPGFPIPKCPDEARDSSLRPESALANSTSVTLVHAL